MGQLYSRLFGKTQCNIIVVGLYNSGKAFLLEQVKLGEIMMTIPTIGLNLERVKGKKVTLTSWDIGGRDRVRPLWRHLYTNARAVVFVIDATQEIMLDSAAQDLDRFLQEDELKDVAFLILVNKLDHAGALSVQDVNRKIDLHRRIRHRVAGVFPVCGLTGEGVWDAFSWLSWSISKKEVESSIGKYAEPTATLKTAARHIWSVNSLVKISGGRLRSLLSNLKH